MVKSAYRQSDANLLISGVKIPYISEMSTISGDYGKKRRNSCTHNKIVLNFPGHNTVVDPDFNVYGSIGLVGLNDEACARLFALYEPEIDAFVYAYLNQVYKRTYPIDLSFNLLNFFREATELPSLLDPAKAVLRNAEQMRSRSKAINKIKKSKRGSRPSRRIVNDAIDDVAGTYVNANFGFVPTINDAFEVTSRFKDLKSKHSELRDQLRKQPRFRKKQELGLPIKRLRTGDLTLDYAAWDSSGSYYIVTPEFSRCVVSGWVKYLCPDFETLGPLLSVLDRTGLRLDLSTIWNAIPFSWAVDWILPVGDALASMAKPWLDIRSEVKGTYSIKMKLKIVYKAKASYNAPLPVTSKDGYAEVVIYRRFLLPPDLSAYKAPPMPNFRIDWNLKRAGILAGIAKGFKSI